LSKNGGNGKKATRAHRTHSNRFRAIEAML
jgi:hypothetical protein